MADAAAPAPAPADGDRPERPVWRLKRSLSSDNIDKVQHPPKWIREKFPTKKLAAKPYLPGFNMKSGNRSRARSLDLGALPRLRRRKKANRGADLFTELRAFYSQEYRLHMLRCALRDSMHRNDMGLNAYWNAIDADGSGALDRQELANAITEAGVETSSMEIDALMEAIDEDKSGLVTQEVFYHWLLSTDDSWMERKRRAAPDDDHNDLALLLRESARFDPSVIEALDAIWVLVDADGSGAVDRDEYLALHSHLYGAMNPQELLNLPPRKRKKLEAKALRIAEREWQMDSQGVELMDKNKFRLSFFQLVDAFIPQERVGPPRVGLSVEEFLRFLRYFVHRLAVPNAAGDPVFRWDDDRVDDWLAALPPLKFDDAQAADRAFAAGARVVAKLTPKEEKVVETKVERERRLRKKKAAAVEEEKGPNVVVVAARAKREVRAIENHARLVRADRAASTSRTRAPARGRRGPSRPRPKPKLPKGVLEGVLPGDEKPKLVVRVPKSADRPDRGKKPPKVGAPPPAAKAPKPEVDAPPPQPEKRAVAPGVLPVVRRRRRAPMSHKVAGADERYTVLQTVMVHERQEFRQNSVLGDQVLRRGADRAQPAKLEPLPNQHFTATPFGHGTHDPRQLAAQAKLEHARRRAARRRRGARAPPAEQPGPEPTEAPRAPRAGRPSLSTAGHASIDTAPPGAYGDYPSRSMTPEGRRASF
ncbi:serine/threonine kinase [Aureococcus anophagefferens]|nr:serine/threonine kinase [Aureococcus anophagefferens]